MQGIPNSLIMQAKALRSSLNTLMHISLNPDGYLSYAFKVHLVESVNRSTRVWKQSRVILADVSVKHISAGGSLLSLKEILAEDTKTVSYVTEHAVALMTFLKPKDASKQIMNVQRHLQRLEALGTMQGHTSHTFGKAVSNLLRGHLVASSVALQATLYALRDMLLEREQSGRVATADFNDMDIQVPDLGCEITTLSSSTTRAVKVQILSFCLGIMSAFIACAVARDWSKR
jgi:hypothetical protein